MIVRPRPAKDIITFNILIWEILQYEYMRGILQYDYVI